MDGRDRLQHSVAVAEFRHHFLGCLDRYFDLLIIVEITIAVVSFRRSRFE